MQKNTTKTIIIRIIIIALFIVLDLRKRISKPLDWSPAPRLKCEKHMRKHANPAPLFFYFFFIYCFVSDKGMARVNNIIATFIKEKKKNLI